MNAPENYLYLIQRREWIPVEIEEKEGEWILPVKKWYVEKANEVYLVHESEREEFYDEKDHVSSIIEVEDPGSTLSQESLAATAGSASVREMRGCGSVGSSVSSPVSVSTMSVIPQRSWTAAMSISRWE